MAALAYYPHSLNRWLDCQAGAISSTSRRVIFPSWSPHASELRTEGLSLARCTLHGCRNVEGNAYTHQAIAIVRPVLRKDIIIMGSGIQLSITWKNSLFLHEPLMKTTDSSKAEVSIEHEIKSKRCPNSSPSTTQNEKAAYPPPPLSSKIPRSQRNA